MRGLSSSSLPQITYFGSHIWEVSCETVINNAIVDLEVPDVGLKKVKISFDYEIYQSEESHEVRNFPSVIRNLEWQILRDFALKSALLEIDEQDSITYNRGSIGCVERLGLPTSNSTSNSTSDFAGNETDPRDLIESGLFGINSSPNDEIDTENKCMYDVNSTTGNTVHCIPVNGYFTVLIPTTGNGTVVDPFTMKNTILTRLRDQMNNNAYQSPDIIKLSFIGQRVDLNKGDEKPIFDIKKNDEIDENRNGGLKGTNTTPSEESNNQSQKYVTPVGATIVAFMALASLLIIFMIRQKRQERKKRCSDIGVQTDHMILEESFECEIVEPVKPKQTNPDTSVKHFVMHNMEVDGCELIEMNVSGCATAPMDESSVMSEGSGHDKQYLPTSMASTPFHNDTDTLYPDLVSGFEMNIDENSVNSNK